MGYFAAKIWKMDSGRWVPLLLFLVALCVRMIRASSVPVIGDQLSSINEAQHLGTNIHGMPYFILLRLWIEMGDSHSTLWVRAPSILMGALSVPVIWWWLRAARGAFVAYATSILMLLSPLAVEYAQEIRYYALYLLSASLFFWAYWEVGIARRRGKYIPLGLAFAASLLVTSHLLGVLVVGLVAGHWLFVRRQAMPRWGRLMIGIVLVGAGISFAVAFLWPSIVEPAYAIFSRLIASGARAYEGPRGWGITTFAKLALLYHFFALGQFVYPLALTISLPGLLVVALFCFLGALALLRERQHVALSFIGIVGLGGALLVYLILDPLLPSSFADSASPKFVLFILPLFLWLCAEGAGMPRTKTAKAVAVLALVLVQGIGLRFLYVAEWSYSGKEECCWIEAKVAIDEVASQGSVIVLADGRASGSAEYYFGDVANVLSAWLVVNANQLLVPQKDYVVLVFSDYREKNRCELQEVLSEFAQYRERFAFVNYPLFIYGYDLSVPSSEDGEVSVVPLPHSLYSLEFQDLRLPQSVNWKGHQIEVTGMFSLPTCGGARDIRFDGMGLSPSMEVSSLLLLSNLTGASHIPDGDPVGTITVALRGGDRVEFALLKGSQTQAWDGECLQGCWSALKWDKKVALVGHSDAYYPDAYRDFDAHIWGTELEFSQPTAIESIEIRLDDPSATLHIWGLYAKNSQ